MSVDTARPKEGEMRLVRIVAATSLIVSSLWTAPAAVASHQEGACATENRDHTVGDPANVVVEYDPRTLVNDAFGDRDATAEAIANEIRAEGEAARARYIQLELPTPALRIKLQCRTLDIFGIDVRRAITLGADNIQVPVRNIEDAFLEGIAAAGPELGSGPWQSPTAAWRDTVHHEAFHGVQMQLWTALGGLYTFRNYFLFQNITASESTATLAQDLFMGMDDTAAAPFNSYLQKTQAFFADKPTIETINSSADAAYQAGAVFQYWAERFGPNQGDDLERRVADFSRLLVGTNKIRTEAMEEALGRDVFEALRDFYVTAYVHDRSQQVGPFAILDEITAHGAAPGVGDGQEYPSLTTVNSALPDADFPGRLLGQGRGEVYDIALTPGTTSVAVSLQSRATGGVEILGAKIGQNWSPLRTAFITVDANGNATIDPALMPQGPRPEDGLTTYTVDVAGKSRLGVIVVAGDDDADYDLQVRSAGIATVSIIAPTMTGPRVIGPAADLEDFEVVVDVTFDGAPPDALRATDFEVTVGGLPVIVKGVLPTIPARFKLLVEAPAGLSDGRHTLGVDFYGDVDSETDAIIVGEAPRAAVSLVIDKSGSMGGARITAAKAAAVQFVQQMELNDSAALVTFDSSAYVNKPMTVLTTEAVRQQFIDAINAITAGGGTNIAAGLASGNQQLAGAGGSGASRAILLLSDGLDSSNVDAVIAQIPADIDAHTIALDTGSDQAKLQHIADATGGVFLFAPSPADLANLYSLIRARITNTELRQLGLGTIGQGGSTSVGFPVAAGASTAAIGISWAGSDFDLSLELPSGRTITETTQAADVVVRSGTGFVTIEVSDPEPGSWQATIVGVDVPSPEEVTLRIEERGSDVAAALALEAVGAAGAPIIARLSVTGADGPLTSATVTALLQRPDGSTVSVPMVDDGGHGDSYAGDGLYAASMSSTRQSGSYTVTVEAAGTDGGVAFVRQEVASIFLAAGTDSDGDGITDETELRLGLDPADPADATSDLDGDGVGTLAELAAEANPLQRDTDDGGESDGSEIAGLRNPLDRTDDADLPEVFARVVPEDSRTVTIHTMTSTGAGSVHIERLGPSDIADLGMFPGAEQSLTDGPLPAGTYSYRFSVVASGAESTPFVLGPIQVLEDATSPTVSVELNGGIWQTTASSVAVLLSTSEPVAQMRFAATREALAVAEWQPFAAQFSYQIGDEPGIKRLYVEVRDAAGNVSAPSVDAVYRAAPTGTGKAWGNNSQGQLGNGTTANSSTPVDVSNLTGITALGAGAEHSLAVRSDGTAWAWGQNANGELGDGTTTDRTTPVQASGITGATAVAGGTAHSLVLKSDGTVRSFGYNQNGQLGDGTTTQRTSSVQVTGLTGVIAIAAGSDHSLALKSDGTVWAWGKNSSGQLGDGTKQKRTTPVRVGTLTGVIAIAAGGDHSLAVKSDGTVWAWGYNFYGELGDGTTTNRTSPVRSGTITGVSGIAAGSNHSLAVKSDGTVWAWGNNGVGQLGDGTTTSRTSPVRSGTITGVTKLAAGGHHSLALKSDGTLWAWGFNLYGQLGDGTTTNRSSAVLVIGLSDIAATAGGAFFSLAATGG
jgi:alpha-tubulin suppressor-like RCC1 family protein/uncharacterized protein YegL